MAKLNYIQFSFHIKYTLLQLVTLQRQNVRLTVISLLKAFRININNSLRMADYKPPPQIFLLHLP